MNVYLAGPMRGKPLYNLHAFAKGALHLRRLGFKVFNPIELDLAEHDLEPHVPLEEQGFDLEEAMRRDFEFIVSTSCNGLVLLPGWQDSKGAVVEAIVATGVGRIIYVFDDEIECLTRLSEPINFSFEIEQHHQLRSRTDRD